jgi:hypothetical protein
MHYTIYCTPSAQDQWPAFVEKMKARGLSEAAVGAFKRNFDQLVAGVTGMVRSPRRLVSQKYGVAGGGAAVAAQVASTRAAACV